MDFTSRNAALLAQKGAGSPELHGGSAGKIIELLTGAFYVGNGWVARGCWDDY